VGTIEQVSPSRRPDSAAVSAKLLRRRWPFILVACVLAFFLLAGGIAFWWIATRLDPIRLNSAAAARVRVEDGQFIQIPTYEPSTTNPITAFLVPWHKGKWLEMGVSVYNYSPFLVTVQGIGYTGPDAFEGPLEQESVRIESIDAPDRLIEFRPFTLAADTARYLVIRYRFANCLPAGIEEPQTYARQWIRYSMRVGWITIHRAQSLPMRYTVGCKARRGAPDSSLRPTYSFHLDKRIPSTRFGCLHA
jgi:hypothetical protein